MLKYAVVTLAVLAMTATGAFAGEVIYTGSGDAVQLGIPVGDIAQGDWNSGNLTSTGASPTGYLISSSGQQGDFYFPVDTATPVATPLAFDIASQDWVITLTVDASADAVSAGIMLRDYNAASGAGDYDGIELQYHWGDQEIVIFVNDGTGWVRSPQDLTHSGPITLRMMANGANIDLQYDIGAGFVTALPVPAPGAGDLQDGKMYPSFRPSQQGGVTGVVLTNIIASGTGVPDVEQTPVPDPNITSPDPFAVIDLDYTLTAPGMGPFQWFLDDSPVGTDSKTLSFTPLQTVDLGKYNVSYDDGLKTTVTSNDFILTALPSGTVLPVTGLLGLGLLVVACAVGGATVLRRKK